MQQGRGGWKNRGDGEVACCAVEAETIEKVDGGQRGKKLAFLGYSHPHALFTMATFIILFTRSRVPA